MPEDERLRDAILELHDLRQREARLLKEAKALFDILNTLTSAETSAEAISLLIDTIQSTLDAEAVGLLVDDQGVLEVWDATQAVFPEGKNSIPYQPIFEKPRNLADVTTVDPWSVFAGHGDAPYRSLLSAPMPLSDGQVTGAIICLHKDRARFSKADRQLLVQIAKLAAQSLRSLDLQARNTLLAAVIDGSSSGFAIANAKENGRPLIFVNRAFERLSGYTSDEVLGQNCRFLNDEDPQSPVRARLRHVVDENGTGTFVLRNKRKDGTPFWNELSLFPVLGADGTAEYLVATQTDVSDRVKAQEESEISRRRMLEALSHTDDGFLLLDSALVVLFSNPQFGQILPAPGRDWAPGTSFSENLAAHVATIPATILAQGPDIAALDLSRIPSKGAKQELPLPDGRTLFLRVQNTVDGGYVVSATDITSIKTAERTLRGRVAAIENAPDGIAIADPDGRVVYANPSLCSILGVASDIHLIGRPWSRQYAQDNGDARMAQISRRLQDRGQAREQLILGAKEADRRWHDVVLRRVDEVGLIIIVRDVTEQRATRIKQFELSDELDQARRQQILSQMAAGLAHDFNNLLAAITGSATLIGGDPAATETLRKHAGRITSAGTQASYLVNRLLDLGRDTNDMSEFDLRHAIVSAVDLVSVNLNDGIQLEMDMAADPVQIVGSATEVTRISLNLLLNAQDALGSLGGKVIIGVRLIDDVPDERPLVGRLDPARRYAELFVDDNGPGIPAEIVDKVFDPYFSTKGATGSGLGLATVASMVVSNNGAIGLETHRESGTRFSVFWPLDQVGDRRVEAETDAVAVDLSGLLVMIVDDDADVAEVVASYLERLGSETAIVNEPELAIESILDDPTAWSLLISDYDMGKMNGGDIVEAAAKGAPALPIFILTALSRRIADSRLSKPSVKAVFAKPPDLRQISVAVAEHGRPPKRERDP